MKFTPNKLADKEIKKYIDIAIEEILKQVPQTVSIIIYGGYGRGEGSFIKKNKKIWPVNDFDTYVITEKKVDPEVLDLAAKNFAKRLKIKGIPFKHFDKTWNFEDNFYLDLKCLTLSELKKLFPMQRYYELKNATNVVYGKDVRNLIPNYKISDISLSEGARLFINRMSHLVEYLSLEGQHDSLTLSFFCTKAFIDSCTSLSILSGRYSPYYKKRMEDFCKHFKKDFPELAKKLPDLPKKVKKYTLWKLNLKGLPEKDIMKLWFDARHYSTECAKYFFSKFLNKKIETLDQLSEAISLMGGIYYKPYSIYYVKNKLGFKLYPLSFFLKTLLPFRFKQLYYKRLLQENINYPRIFKNKSSPDLLIPAAMIHILYSLNKDLTLNKENFQKGLKKLQKIYPVKASTWDEISQEYANAYVLFYLLKIV